MKRYFIGFLAISVCCLMLPFLGNSRAFASCAPKNQALNVYEYYVEYGGGTNYDSQLHGNPHCANAGSASAIGTIWITQDANNCMGVSSGNTAQLSTITAEWNQSTVTAYLAGSVYAVYGSVGSMKANDIKEEGSTGNKNYLSDMPSWIQRGGPRVNGGEFSRNSSCGSNPVTINIDKIVPQSKTGGEADITIGLFRCSNNNMDSPYNRAIGICAVSYVPIKVVRKPIPRDWQLRLHTSVTTDGSQPHVYGPAGTVNANLGQTGKWGYFIWTPGTTKIDRAVKFSSIHSNGWSGGVNNFRTLPNPTNLISDWRPIWGNPYIESRKFSQDDVGKTFCSKVSAKPGSSSSDSSSYASNNTCIHVMYNYSGCDPTVETCSPPPPPRNVYEDSGVTPITKLPTGASITAGSGDKITFDYNLKNSGPTKTKPLGYEAHTFIMRKGANASVAESRVISGSSSTDFNSASCANRVGSIALKCDDASPLFSYRNKNYVIGQPTTVNVGRASITVDENGWDADPGDKICSYLTVSRWRVVDDQETPSVRSSNISCVEIVKSPQIQINGADSFSQQGFAGAAFTSSNLNNRNRGSWSQYGLLSNGFIDNFGSAGYNLFKTSSINNFAKSSKLWFANTNTSNPGNFGMNHTFQDSLPNVKQITDNKSKYYPPTSSGLNYRTSTLDLSQIRPSRTSDSANNTIVYYLKPTSGALNLTNRYNQAIEKGARIMLYVDGKVNLKNNITYPTFFNKIREIPSLIIYATADINIESNITELSGVFISQNGAINTCANNGNIAASRTNKTHNTHLGETGICHNQLIINGALVSKNSPTFQRTFGATKENPSLVSEKIKYQPNLYLTANNFAEDRSSGETMWKTVSETNLPARW